jgi:hypothetical protein
MSDETRKAIAKRLDAKQKALKAAQKPKKAPKVSNGAEG